MKTIVSLGLVTCGLLIASNAYSASVSKTLTGGNSTFGYTATAGFSDSYASSGTLAYRMTPYSTVKATILNNSITLFAGSDTMEFRRDSKVRNVRSLAVANVSVLYDDVTVFGKNDISVALVKEGPGYQQQFMVSVIPVIVTVKPSLSLGIKGTVNATATGCALSAGVPYVDAAIKASGGVGCSAASAGIEGSLSLLYSELQVAATMNYSTRGIVYGVNWVTRTLSGTLSAYAKASASIPNPWGAKINVKYTKAICSWPGASLAKMPIYNVSTRF